MGRKERISVKVRYSMLFACAFALLFLFAGCGKDDESTEDPSTLYVPSDEFSITFSDYNPMEETYDFNVLRLYDKLEGEPLSFEIEAYDKNNRELTVKKYDGDGTVPYEYKRYIYRFNDKEALWVGTHCYEDGSEYIDYLWSDISSGVKTYRGIGVDSSLDDIIRAYPEDLYYLSRNELGDEAGTTAMAEYKDKSGKFVSSAAYYNCAYFYQPFEDNDVRDIHFYMRDGKVAAIEIFSPFELRHVYSGERSNENLVLKPSEKEMTFKTEAAAKGDYTIHPTWEDLSLFTAAETLPEPAVFKYDLLRLDASIPQSDKVNAIACGDKLLNYIAQVESGNGISYIKDTHYQNWSIRCHTEQYRDVIAFVIDEKYGVYEAGAGSSMTVFYYDAKTCNWISKEEYANRCSVDKDKIVKLYNADLPYEDMAAYNIYDTEFYVDANGKTVIGYTYSV